MRLFLAINLPEEVRDAAHAASAELRSAAPVASWADPSRLHLTLKFLGEVTEAACGVLEALVARVGNRHEPFAMELGGVGAFPSVRAPRIVWLGVVPSEPLAAVQRDIEAECAALGYERDVRPFRPHITLGRMKGRGSAALARLATDVQYQATVRVEAIDLMQSRLAGAGPRYAAKTSARLRTH